MLLWDVSAVYMVFGFLDVWGRLPVNFFLKDDLHWSPSQVSLHSFMRLLPLCNNEHMPPDASLCSFTARASLFKLVHSWSQQPQFCTLVNSFCALRPSISEVQDASVCERLYRLCWARLPMRDALCSDTAGVLGGHQSAAVGHQAGVRAAERCSSPARLPPTVLPSPLQPHG